MPRFGRLAARLLAALLVAVAVAACGGSAAPSFDPTGACTTDGSAPGAYPELEALVPTRYMDAAPEKLDSGRNCSDANLGSLKDIGITEVRFAGGTWTFGAERAAVLAVFTAPGLTAAALGDLYLESARTANRTKITNATEPTIEGRSGRRLDTETGSRVADRPGLAVGDEGPGQRRHHERPAGRPDRRCRGRLRRPLTLGAVLESRP